MLIFYSLYDVLIDSVLDIDDLSDIERFSLIASLSGVQYSQMTPDLKTSFKSASKKWLKLLPYLKTFYERG